MRHLAIAVSLLLSVFSAFAFVGPAREAYASHTDSSGNPLPHATLKVWNAQPIIGFDPDESVEDISGLTTHVGSPAIVTVYENTKHPGGPCGIAFWNPDTNFFKWYGITGGFQASVDLNRSAPTKTSGTKTFQPGDAWAGGPTGKSIYVNFKGSDNFRGYLLPFGQRSWGLEVDQTSGNVWYAGFEDGTINRLDPATSTRTSWSVGGQPRYVTRDSTGRIYATVGGLDQIVRVDPATNAVTRWAVPGPGPNFAVGFVFQTPDGITTDASGDIWFTESQTNQIGRLRPSTNVITELTKTGLANPQLIATSGTGDTLQAFFTEGAGNAVSVVTSKEAVGFATTVALVATTVTPTTSTVLIEDFTRTPLTATILPSTFDIPGLDGGPDATGTTKTATGERIPGILRFPMPDPSAFPSGMTGVFKANSIAGSWLGSDKLFKLESGAIIAPPPGESVGKVTGGGTVNVTGGIANFGFVVMRTTAGGPIKGQLEYNNKATGANVHSVAYTSLVIAGNTATFKGTCTNNGSPCTFTVKVEDNGEPGTADSFTISVSGGAGEGGVLRSGNIQIH